MTDWRATISHFFKSDKEKVLFLAFFILTSNINKNNGTCFEINVKLTTTQNNVVCIRYYILTEGDDFLFS